MTNIARSQNFWIAFIISALVCSGLVMLVRHAGAKAFHDVVGVYPAEGKAQLEQVPAIMTKVKILREKATISWNDSQKFSQQADALIVGPGSSLQTAEEKQELRTEAASELLEHQSDWIALTWACSLLESYHYPATARSACPTEQ